MKKSLLFAAAAVALGASAQNYTVVKLWGSENVPASADCRQGVGLNGKFYINDKSANADEGIEPKVLVYGENGLANEQFPGGPNCGIGIDQAGHLIVSLATFPNAGSWVFDDATPMIRVIDPATGEVTDLPLGGGAVNDGRLDVLGHAYGNLLESGELYLPGLPANGNLQRYYYEDGEVLGEDCYSPLLNPVANADNMTIVKAVVDADGNDALFYYQRGANPYLYYFEGDNLEGEQINIPASENGMIRSNQNGAAFFAYNGKNFVVYPCGAANNAYFDGFGILEIGADAPLFVKEPTIAAAPNAFQANWLDAEVTEDGVLIYQYVPGKSMEVYKLSIPAEEPAKVYIIGDAPFGAWDPSNGTEMTYNNGLYTLDVTIPGTCYFSFTTALGETNTDWDAIRPYRLGAQANGFNVNDVLGQTIELGEYGESADNALLIAAGEYTITLDLENRTVVVTGASVVEETLYVIGDFNGMGWDPSKAEDMEKAEDGTLTFVLGHIDAGCSFKFITDKVAGWDGKYYGPVAGSAYVTLGEPAEMVENADGNFMIENAGTYTITVNADFSEVTVTGEEDAQTITLEGYVYDVDENGLAGVDVTATLVTDEPEGLFRAEGDVTYTTITDAEGYYTLTVPAGNYTLTFAKEGYQSVTMDAGQATNGVVMIPLDPTAVADINASKAVASVTYVNAAGQVSNTAFSGINMQVTTYADGTRSVVKVVK